MRALRTLRAAEIPADARPEEPEWLALHRVADAHDSEVRDAVIEDRDSVVSAIDLVALAAALALLSVEAAEDAIAWQTNSTLAERLTPAMEASAVEGAAVAQRFSPVTVDTQQAAGAAQVAARTRVDELVAGLEDQTLRGIRTGIAAVLEQNLDDLEVLQSMVGLNQQQVQSVLGFHSRLASRGVAPASIRRRVRRFARRQLRLRAQNVGRTESIAAVHLGQGVHFELALTQDLLERGTVRRRWIVTPDDRLDRKICRPMRNQVVGLDEKFITGLGDAIDRPPAHPRCRCSVVFEVKERISVAKHKSLQRLILGQIASDQIRTEAFQGVDHLVVPVVALVQGVHHAANAPGPELALASEFARKAEAWNGRPVTLGHPVRDGQLVSAARPDVLEEDAVGLIFNAQLDGDRLRMEAWIDLEKVEEIGDRGAQLLQRLEEGEQIEVSTGLFSVVEESAGTHEGEEFTGIWREILPDHLAMLAEGERGACSWEDGCGAPRVAELWHLREGDADREERGPVRRALDWLRELGGRLTFRGDQRDVSDSDIREALRGAIRDAETASDFVWVLAVFPDSSTVVYETEDGTFRRAFELGEGAQVLSLGAERVEVRPVTEFVPVTPGVPQESRPMTREARVQALIDHQALRFEDADRAWLMALSDEQLGKLEPPEEEEPDPDGEGGEGAGAPAPTGGPAAGAPSPADAAGGGQPNPPTSPAPTAASSGQACTSCGHAPDPPDPQARTAEEYARGAPAEIRELMLEGVASARAERTEIVKHLQGLAQCEYSEADLKAMSLADLRRLAKIARVNVYEGRVVPRVHPDADDGFAPAPPSLWDKPSDGAAASA